MKNFASHLHFCWCLKCTFVNINESLVSKTRLSQTKNCLKFLSSHVSRCLFFRPHVCSVSFYFVYSRERAREPEIVEWIVNESTGQQRTLLVGGSRGRELLCVKADERRSSFFFVNELIRMGRKRSSRVRCRRFITRQTLFDVSFFDMFDLQWSVKLCGGERGEGAKWFWGLTRWYKWGVWN